MCGLHWFHTESPTIVSISQHKVHFKALSEPFSCISADVDQRKLDLDLRSFSFHSKSQKILPAQTEPFEKVGIYRSVIKGTTPPTAVVPHNEYFCCIDPHEGRDQAETRRYKTLFFALVELGCVCATGHHIYSNSRKIVLKPPRAEKLTIFQLLRTSRKTRCKSRVRTRRAAPRGKQRFCWRKLNDSACLAADAR